MFGIENVFTFVLIFFFLIWIGNESEDRVPPYLVRIRQSGRVGSGRVHGDDRELTVIVSYNDNSTFRSLYFIVSYNDYSTFESL